MMFLTLIVVLITLSWLYLRKKHNYWCEQGIPFAPGYFPFGSSLVWKCLIGQESLLQVGDKYFDNFPGTIAFGFYKPFGKPVFVVKDLDLARKIMVKDFEHFVDRDFLKPNPKSNKHASLMLVNLKGETWKANRNLLTPMFTSSKLKMIMPLLHQCGEDLSDYIKGYPEDHIDNKKVYQRFTIEILGNLGCGIKPNVLKHEDNVFYDEAMILSGNVDSIKAGIRFAINFFFPDLSYKLDLSVFEQKNFEFFVDIIRRGMKMREGGNFRRNDFIDLLLDSVKELEADKKQKAFSSEEDIEDCLIANGLMLFFVGNDTSSGALALIMHFLAKHPDVQEKLYDEIKEAIDSNGGDVNLEYDTLNNLQYMGKVIKEAIRLWGVNFFDRTCTKDYYIPELNYTIPKGMHVTFAGGKIMRDEANFEDPQSFDPDNHFDSDTIFPTNFLGFGQGPRHCIGLRLAYTMIRTGILHTLSNFKIAKGPKTADEWFFSPIVPGGISHDQLFVKLVPRNE